MAKGFSHVPGVYYNQDEVYAPVIKHDSLKTLLALTAKLDLFLHTLDVKTTFLYGDLKEYLLVEQPEGFIQPGTEQLVCHLLRPLYGLVQSPRKCKDKFLFLRKIWLDSLDGRPLSLLEQRRESRRLHYPRHLGRRWNSSHQDQGKGCSNHQKPRVAF